MSPLHLIAGIGSRETPPDILVLMTALAADLARQGGYVRSGHADGADQAFERGAGDHCLVYLPWPSFNGPLLNGAHALLFDAAHPDAQERAWASLQQFHPAPQHLTHGVQLLLARDYFQVMGAGEEERPVEALVCWATVDRQGQEKGGTGQACRIARHHNIPIYNYFMLSDLDIRSKLGV